MADDKKEPVTTESTATLENIDAQIRLDFKQTFGPEYGKNVLYYLANKFDLFAVHNVSDPLRLAFEEGQRSVVLEIIEKCAAGDPRADRQKILKEVIYG
jgi:hypothetical protein